MLAFQLCSPTDWCECNTGSRKHHDHHGRKYVLGLDSLCNCCSHSLGTTSVKRNFKVKVLIVTHDFILPGAREERVGTREGGYSFSASDLLFCVKQIVLANSHASTSYAYISGVCLRFSLRFVRFLVFFRFFMVASVGVV